MVNQRSHSVEVDVQTQWAEPDDPIDAELDETNAKFNKTTVCSDIAPVSSSTWDTWFQVWINALDPDYSPIQSYELSLRLTHDADIQTLNAQYRNIDTPTDVLAFAALEVDYPQIDDVQAFPVYLGDIVISLETAQRQADEQQHSLQVELAWLASHGLLHLLGWDHPDDESLSQMVSQQETLLAIVGLTL
ncbi:MAG TPA: rRNA maturation RNase YbeY [Elainellaceae cyanobacterium]